MKVFNIFLMSVLIIVLSGCSSDEKQNENIANDYVEGEETIGFEMANGEVKAAENIDENTSKQILAAFDEYIAAFNAEDIERYMATLSKNEAGFNLEEERKAAVSAFETYEIERIAEDVTITEYKTKTANVYATIKINLTESETGAQLSSVGRQISVLENTVDGWKIASIYYIGNE